MYRHALLLTLAITSLALAQTKQSDAIPTKEKLKGADVAKNATLHFDGVKASIKKAAPVITSLFTDQPITQNTKQLIAQTIQSLNAATVAIGKDIASFKEAKDKGELEAYYAAIEKAFQDSLVKDKTIEQALKNIFRTNALSPKKQKLLTMLQRAYAPLVYVIKNIDPEVMGKEVADVGFAIGKHQSQLTTVLDQGKIDQATSAIMQQIGKELQEVAAHLAKGDKLVQGTPLEDFYRKAIDGLIAYQLLLIAPIMDPYLQIRAFPGKPLTYKQSTITATPAQRAVIQQLQADYKKIRTLMRAK